MEVFFYILIAFVVMSVLGAIIGVKEDTKKAKELFEAKQARMKENKMLTVDRTKTNGPLTKEIICKSCEKNIQVYKQTEKIFIENQEFNFSDVLSCKVNLDVIKGKERHITTPDKGHKYNMQALYGLDWEKHISKYNTEVIREPDIKNYIVIVRLKSIETPQIVLELGDDMIAAYEIEALFDEIVR